MGIEPLDHVLDQPEQAVSARKFKWRGDEMRAPDEISRDCGWRFAQNLRELLDSKSNLCRSARNLGGKSMAFVHLRSPFAVDAVFRGLRQQEEATGKLCFNFLYKSIGS